MSSTSGHVLSTAMHRRIEHIAAELLICRSPASISNNIFYAVFTYFLGFSTQKALASGAGPQTPVGKLTALPRTTWLSGGVPPPAPSPGRSRLLLHPTPCHTLVGAPTLTIAGSASGLCRGAECIGEPVYRGRLYR